MKKLICGAMLTALAVGCVTVNKNDGGDSAIAPNVIKDTIREKYEVGKAPITGKDKVNCLFGWISWGSTATHIADLSDSGFGGIGSVKNGAYANACDAGKCDAIVGTRYKVTVKEWTWKFHLFDQYEAELTGYPVTVKGADVIPADTTKGFCQGGTEKTGKPPMGLGLLGL